MATANILLSKLDGLRFFGRRAKLYDLFAASPLIIWNIAALWLQWHPILRDLTLVSPLHLGLLATLDLVSRLLRFVFAGLLVVLLIVRRTPVKRYPGLFPRLVALFGAYGGVAAQVLPVNPALNGWLIVSSLLTIGGISFAVLSVSWLGRSFGVLPESRKLVTSGPYSVVRHPLYLGEQTAVAGIALQSGSALVAAILAVQTLCQLYRMRCEEQVLTDSFPEYAQYREKTALIIPWVY
jgi:protein-S-isoprenylcysteine O-methyltransferase Ste14